MSELIARDQHRVNKAWSGDAPPYLLSEECSAEHLVVAAFVAGDAC